MAFVTGQDLAVGYDGRPVASNISFEVSSGDLLCVIGENGAGKSTLVKTLLGLQAPVSGTLAFGDGVRADEVGYLPQRGETQRDFPTSVAEIVLSGCLSRLGWRPFFGAEERRVASESLERVGCTHLKDASFADLSGGQQQRVLIARALCAATRLLVLDEPARLRGALRHHRAAARRGTGRHLGLARCKRGNRARLPRAGARQPHVLRDGGRMERT